MTEFEVKIDLNSNLYINNYWITINKDNNLEAISIDSKFNMKNKVKIVEKLDEKINRKLQAKLIDDEISKYVDDDDDVFNDDEDDVQMIENYMLNPETKYINYHDDENSENDDLESYYDIHGVTEYSENLLELSLYEFYYFGSDSNDLKYYTRIVNDNPIYRISFYEKNRILRLNIIGDIIKTFKIVLDKEKNTLQFIKIKMNLA
jgi:hypothetical protein